MIQFPWYVYISGHSHIALRNYILGPISEEFYFRCCMVSLLIGSNHKLLSVLFWCFCIYFCGIYFSLYLFLLVPVFEHIMNSEIDYKNSGFMIGLLLQSIFSAMFGIVELLLLIRLSIFIYYYNLDNFYSILLFHSLCNILEFPSFNWISKKDSVYQYRYCIDYLFLYYI